MQGQRESSRAFTIHCSHLGKMCGSYNCAIYRSLLVAGFPVPQQCCVTTVQCQLLGSAASWVASILMSCSPTEDTERGWCYTTVSQSIDRSCCAIVPMDSAVPSSLAKAQALYLETLPLTSRLGNLRRCAHSPCFDDSDVASGAIESCSTSAMVHTRK